MSTETDDEFEAALHHFEFDPANGKVFKDEYGDTLEGWYYQFVKISTKEPICGLYGPYPDQDGVEQACNEAWERGDY